MVWYAALRLPRGLVTLAIWTIRPIHQISLVEWPLSQNTSNFPLLLGRAIIGQQQHCASLQFCVWTKAFVVHFIKSNELVCINAKSLRKLSWRLVVERSCVVIRTVFPLIVAFEVGFHVLHSSALILLHQLAGSGQQILGRFPAIFRAAIANPSDVILYLPARSHAAARDGLDFVILWFCRILATVRRIVEEPVRRRFTGLRAGSSLVSISALRCRVRFWYPSASCTLLHSWHRSF